MSGESNPKQMKSAYEVALERLERQGVEPPSPGALSEQTKEAMAEARSRAEASLAELEILHRDRKLKVAEPGELEEEQQRYLEERQRIGNRLEREIARLRADG